MTSPHQITRLLRQLRSGRQEARDELFALVYPELRRLAAAKIRRERPGLSFQATDLVHEVFLRLMSQKTEWNDRVHFYAVASQFMRRLLVDRARRRLVRRQAPLASAPWGEDNGTAGQVPEDPTRLLSLHQALDRLAEFDERQARIVEMRFFGGMTEDEIAAVLEVSPRTVKRDWVMARAFLKGVLAA